MDPYVADPHWRDYIIWYFFLGGIAAGAYALAALVDLFGGEDDRRGVRVAYYLAFPLINLCGLLLVIDLGRPERFWHMLIQSETYRPMFKWWSPMSAGSWGLSAFGGFTFVSFLGALAEDDRLGLGRWAGLARRLRTGVVGKVYALGGAASAFFLGSYTGSLLSATNQPAWAETTWLAPLFLASAVSTGVAAVVLVGHWVSRDVPHEVVERIERADGWAMGLEFVLLIALAVSLGGLAARAFTTWPGVLIPAFVVPVGLILPLAVRRFAGPRGAWTASALVLLGGFALRAAVVGMPGAFLRGHP